MPNLRFQINLGGGSKLDLYTIVVWATLSATVDKLIQANNAKHIGISTHWNERGFTQTFVMPRVHVAALSPMFSIVTFGFMRLKKKTSVISQTAATSQRFIFIRSQALEACPEPC